jgi:nucleoid-associated protein YgaU
MSLRGFIRLTAVAAADLAVLATMTPDWPRLVTDLGAPHRWLARVGPDEAALTVVGAAIWCAAGWLAIALCFASAAALPGRAGAFARAVAGRLLPAVLMRAVAGAAGVSVLIAPVAARGTTLPGRAAAAPAVPAPSWPVDPQHARVHIGWPTDAPTPPPRRPDTRAAAPAAPAHSSGTASTAGTARTVRVQPGESLWLIAARRLSPHASDSQIAGAWPRWYAANAQVIGDDPALIRPGEVLRAPDAG